MKITKQELKEIIKEELAEVALDEGADLKIPVETYDAFKKRFEQWAMLFDKFVASAGTDMIHPDFQPKKEGTKYRKMLFKLSSELQDLMKQYKLQYKYYDDEKHKARKQLDTFGDHNSQYFIEEDNDWIQKAVDPEHEGDCTPMTKKTCTPARKALAKRFKKAAKKKEKKGGTGWQGKV